jgi:hypothetical protein
MVEKPPVHVQLREESREEAASGISAALAFLAGEARRIGLHRLASRIQRAAKQAAVCSRRPS